MSGWGMNTRCPRQANILKQKDKKLEQKDRELGLERGLWKSRNDGWNPSKGPALHLL